MRGTTLRTVVVRLLAVGLVCALTQTALLTKSAISIINPKFFFFIPVLLTYADKAVRSNSAPSKVRCRRTVPSLSKMYADGASRMMMSCKRIKP
jgi:hypothetical protein